MDQAVTTLNTCFLREKATKKMLSYICIVNEIMMKTKEAVRNAFMKKLKPMLQPWIEEIAFVSDNIDDFNTMDSILSNFKHKFFMPTNEIDVLMSVYLAKKDVLEKHLRDVKAENYPILENNAIVAKIAANEKS